MFKETGVADKIYYYRNKFLKKGTKMEKNEKKMIVDALKNEVIRDGVIEEIFISHLDEFVSDLGSLQEKFGVVFPLKAVSDVMHQTVSRVTCQGGRRLLLKVLEEKKKRTR